MPLSRVIVGASALWLAGIPAAFGQPVGLGFKAGLPLADTFELVSNSYRSQKPKLTLGPFVEFRISQLVAIEFDALREKLRFDYSGASGPGLPAESSTTRAAAWQFPLLLKVRLSRGSVRPFVLGGVAAYYINDVNQSGELIAALPTAIRTALKRTGSSFVNGGGVLGGGVEFKVGPLRIGPEIRLTHWAVDKTVGTADVSLKLKQSQAHFFLSASF